jgi:PAS domain S-box-containing protein
VIIDVNVSEFESKSKFRDRHAVIIIFIIIAISASLIDVMIDAFVYHYGSFWDIFFSTSPGIIYGRIYIVISFLVIGVFMDLYLRARRQYTKKLEEEILERTRSLKDSQEKLKSIFAASPDAITAIDFNGKIVECNEKACRMHGYSREELINMNILELIANEDKQRISKHLKNSSNEVENIEYRAVRKEGNEFPAEFSTSVLLNASKEPMGFVTVVKDISKRKQMEQELLKSERLAAIGELAGMVGHDMRNPLTGIANATYVLKTKGKSKMDNTELEMIGMIEKCVDYSNKIINDLLDYSRALKLELIETNPKLLLTQALSLLQVPANVHLVDKTHREPTLRVDSAKMQRVFLNLINNALDAMPNGGKLLVESHGQNGQVLINFSDTGVGIPEESMHELWTPLKTTKAKGMGFGLSICKRIVEAHGGRISVSSILRKGTVFTLTLPTNLST